MGRSQAGLGAASETGLSLARARWRRDPFSVGPSAPPPVSPHGGSKGRRWGLPVPTFLHQLLVSERTAHDQEHGEKYEAQDDARHGARARARRVWILACGEAEGSGQSHPKPSSRREAAGQCPRRITGTCGRQLSVWLSVHPSLDFPAAHPLIYHLSSSD